MFGFSRNESERGQVAPEEARRLGDVLAAIDAPVVVVGADGAIRAAGPAAARLLGLEAEALCGRPAVSWFPAVSADAPSIVTVRDAGGAERPIRVTRRPLGAEPGAHVLVLHPGAAPAGDVDARLAKMNEGLRALSVISHKINNPLTALLGRAQILKSKTQGDPAIEKAAGVIEESASRIADLARELSRTLRDCREESVEAILASESARPPAGRD